MSQSERANHGWRKIHWVEMHMPIVRLLEDRLHEEQPFKELKVAVCIHLEAKTARLALALRNLGAQVAVTSSNPLSAQDDVALALGDKVQVFARRGASQSEYLGYLKAVLNTEPDLVLDDGGDLALLLHGELAHLAPKVLGLCEETTTGVRRLRRLEREGTLRFPAVAVNDAHMKYLFDNRYGTGQSVWDAVMRSTNLLIAGKTVVVAGYGWCGRGIALRAKGLGAQVVVAEVDPVRAAEALMEGFLVVPLREAIAQADFVITATGCTGVVQWEDILNAKPGAILANAGHFDVEIDVQTLRARAQARPARDQLEEFTLPNGKRVYLLAQGRLVNLVAGDGHPAEIMDLSFALQLLTLRWLVGHRGRLAPWLYPVPPEVDEEVARLFLESRGVRIDTLTDAQRAYLEHG